MKEGTLLWNFSSVQVAQSCPTLCKPMHCSMPGFPVLRYLLEFAQIHVHWVSDAIQPSHPLSPSSPSSLIFTSIRVFSNEMALCIRWPKYWSISFSISPSNEYSGLISFRIVWFYLLAVQGTLKHLFQYHNSKASILPCSAFFMVQLSLLWLCNYYSLNTTISWLVNRNIREFCITKTRI